MASPDEKYYAIVVDSGAIIKHAGFQTLHNAGNLYFSPPGVLEEIRDKQARQHLDALPFHLHIREPTSEGLKKVIEFSKKTGDYASLSVVDLHVLALLYDLEKEGCQGNVVHIRHEPQSFRGSEKGKAGRDHGPVATTDGNNRRDDQTNTELDHSDDHVSISLAQDTEIDEEEEEEKEGDQDMIQDVKGNTGDDSTNQLSKNNSNQTQKTWASIVNPTFPSLGNHDEQLISIQNKLHILQVGSNDKYTARNDDGSECGQFSDADEDTDPFFLATKAETTVDNDDDGDSSSKYGDSSVDISDEECDAYILDPEEAHERLQLLGKTLFQANTSSVDEQEFPSLINNSSKASSDDSYNHTGSNKLRKWEQIELEESERRKESLKPISANGKLYQSFHKYKDIISSTGINQKYLRHPNKLQGMHEEEKELPTLQNDFSSTSNFQSVNIQSMSTVSSHSRIIGGASMSGQGTQVEDDGEGWITCVKDIHSNSLSRVSDQRDSSSRDANSNNLPSRHQRTACATTDFAIQNVALQMNLELLTVDGVRVRKLKSWVSRCAACYTVYTGTENTRLFCGRCGASSLQRVAASVDGVTGRFRLHLKKNYKHNLRGTQYNLPAPGKGNKFMGDLLLREDQLLYGAWNQKLKKSMSPKSQSIFGADITSSLGYLTDLSKRDDIKVGFGGKNPNASKFGRERRGKKKKSTEDKACGLRRY